MSRIKKILIGGGGTGGHVFPAISIGQALKRIDPGIDLLFVGAEKKLEMEKVPEAGFKIEGLPVSGFQRRLSIKNLSFFYKLWRSARKSVRIIREFAPDAAVGVGGYASGPILRAASRKNIPIAIQEQNSYAGVTNRILAKKAKKIFVAWEGMDKYFPAEKIILTGNPVRDNIKNIDNLREEGLKHFGLVPQKPVVLVIGGSLGAGTINKSIHKGLESFGDDVQLIWQCGKLYYEQLKNSLKETGDNIKLFPFIAQMEYAFAAADVIISRAGAGTISELELVGKPVILVPSPNVAEDHQTKNAMALVTQEAAIHVADRNAENVLVEECMRLLKDSEKQKILSQNIKKMALSDSADRIAEEILKMI